MMNRTAKLVLTSSALFLAFFVGRPDTAQAALPTSNVTVTAKVVKACTISNATLAFGAYNPTATSDTTQSVALGFKCSAGTPITIDLSNGQNPTGTIRGMANTTNILQYQIYSNSGLTTVWGTGAGSNNGMTATGGSDSLTMYGKIPALQTSVIEGNYQDIVVATLNF
jgi:spore coat protein U-like protein